MSTKISGKTHMYCLLGSPVAHSLSPAMHNAAFSALNMDCRYLAFDISPNQLPDVVQAFRAMKVSGWNLTMPLKETIIPLLDSLSKASALSGSVNTVYNDSGKLMGDTTDGRGFLMALSDSGCPVPGKKIVILGAGGAAKSIIAEASLQGVSSISIFKRNNLTFENTVSFAEKISSATGCPVKVFAFEDRESMKKELEGADLLVNATNVGMADNPVSPVPKEMLEPGLFVSDLIYSPPLTPLLVDAREIGCKIMNGKDMLMYQGACSFKIWTGHDMPLDAVRPIFKN